VSAPHITIDCLPYLCAKKICHIWWKFDVVITKIILLVFLDMVYIYGMNVFARIDCCL